MSTCYNYRVMISVHLEGEDSKMLKGFFIQARKIGNEAPSSEQHPVGVFDIIDTKT